ncbi:PREDICTED: taste receptor type 2 member 40-like [Haliaeetus leucocephalus]|uniref:taste receptor type 2 member 40-like n=1 Tax=Haliaeetus leucocephalus TaxID=52644 RepID=UPI00053CE373|nr:PREDICTED: taste receptor type 2 member 40-like [Haliaeetus leucocephalus]
MLPPALIISISIVAIEVVAGFIGNGFITAVNIINWIKSKKISSADKILIFLSTSRLILQVTILMHIHSLYFADAFKLASVYKAFGAVWMFVNHASLWFSTWLYVLYCVKIINVTQWLLLQIKLRIAGMVPWLLLGSLVISSATSLPLLWITPSTYLCSSTGNCIENRTAHITDWDRSYLYLLLLYFVGCFFPLVLSVVTSALLITSLRKHTKKMQPYVDTFRDPLIDVHLTVIKSIISFLILYLSSFVAQILLILSTSQSKDVVKVAVSLVVAGAYPSIHSIILIIVNSKLKLAFRILCQHFKCHLENMTLSLML